MKRTGIKQGLMVSVVFAILICIGLGFRFAAEAGKLPAQGTSTPTAQTKLVGTVTPESLEVHVTDNANSKIMGRLLKNSSAYIISSRKGWYEISFNAGKGWILGKSLSNLRPATLEQFKNSKTSSILGSTRNSSSSKSGSVPLPSIASSGSFISTASAVTSSQSTGSSSASLAASAANSSYNGISSSTRASSAAVSSTAANAMPFSNLPSKIVAGYYANWSAYKGFTPDKISISSMDVVHYAFAEIGSDLKIAVGDPDVDYSNYSKLNALKRSKPGLITLITVGGWDGSARFSDMALTDASRTAFAKSCVAFIKQYGFDGVDIDWEYPVGGGKTAGRSSDRYNFALLLKTLRETLNAQAKADGKYYYLTIAGGASNSFASGVQLSTISSYLDYAVIMTYDLHGPWDSYTDFNAPLYSPTEPSPQYKSSTASSVQSWLNTGFPASKLVMGVPFYGYIYSGVSSANHGLFQTFSSGKAIGYDSIVKTYLSNSSYTKYTNTGGQVPYLYGNGTFISYDDASSIAAKARYSSLKGLRGAAAWELSFDQSYTLIHSVYNNIK